MRVNKTQNQRITDDYVTKLRTDIKNFVIKMKNEIKERDKVINEYAIIRNGTKKEYQKLYVENIKYREKLKRQEEYDRQEKDQQIKEKEMYKKKQ